MDMHIRTSFSFNGDFIVKCDTQAEIDSYWSRLAVPEAEQWAGR
jgi:predicted 3-demethylubiquinone-9 3-methyltransferase (glyoxalase superfamily)